MDFSNLTYEELVGELAKVLSSIPEGTIVQLEKSNVLTTTDSVLQFPYGDCVQYMEENE